MGMLLILAVGLFSSILTTKSSFCARHRIRPISVSPLTSVSSSYYRLKLSLGLYPAVDLTSTILLISATSLIFIKKLGPLLSRQRIYKKPREILAYTYLIRILFWINSQRWLPPTDRVRHQRPDDELLSAILPWIRRRFKSLFRLSFRPQRWLII
jgi:hypothetical protein